MYAVEKMNSSPNFNELRGKVAELMSFGGLVRIVGQWEMPEKLPAIDRYAPRRCRRLRDQRLRPFLRVRRPLYGRWTAEAGPKTLKLRSAAVRGGSHAARLRFCSPRIERSRDHPRIQRAALPCVRLRKDGVSGT